MRTLAEIIQNLAWAKIGLTMDPRSRDFAEAVAIVNESVEDLKKLEDHGK